jgi:hypothetical protein
MPPTIVDVRHGVAARSSRPERLRGLWWLSPPGAVCLIVLPTLLLAAISSDATFRTSWGTPKALTDATVELFLVGTLLFVLGAAWPQIGRRLSRQHRNWPGFTDAQWRVVARAEGPLFWATMLGYAGFVLSGLRHGLGLEQFRAALIGQDTFEGGVKQALTPIPGVTTLTEVGIAYVVVGFLLLARQADRRTRWRIAIVFALGLGRTFFVAERLALIELAVPALAVLALRHVDTVGRRARAALLAAPLLLIPAALVAFGAFEYSRSWVFYSARTSQTFPEFVVNRFEGYYATAYNNGQLTLTYDRYPGRLPYHSLEALWTAPGADQLGLYEALSGRDHAVVYDAILTQHGNPEFNSPSGVAIPFVDFGVAGGALFLFVGGSVLGWLYRRCCEGGPMATLVYPVFVTGLFELPRYLYWTEGRLTPSLVALAVVGVAVGRVSSSTVTPEDTRR